jgi:hypothetical protein
MQPNDLEFDEPMTLDVVAEILGARRSLVAKLAEHGLIETEASETGETLLRGNVIVRLRRMQRLRRDLGVNFTGAAIILDLVDRIQQINRELVEMHRRFNE